MTKQVTIWGAGIAGLIAANVFPQAQVFEKSAAPTSGGNHKALLRFRSAAVGEACGIEFRRVRVHKGIWHRGAYVLPDILAANQYSLKVLGRLADRSIWSLDPVDRFIAPESFFEQLLDRVEGRVHWGQDVASDTDPRQGPVISTIPMPALYEILFGPGPLCNDPGQSHAPSSAFNKPKFERSAITVARWRVPGADVYQTAYVPDPETSCYRVSMTGDILIAEYMGQAEQFAQFDPAAPFGVWPAQLEPLGEVKQSFGKIAPINDAWRKQFIFHASHVEGVFSLGRFGTWRNILLDDVLHDCAVIKRMMAADAYGRSQEMWKP